MPTSDDELDEFSEIYYDTIVAAYKNVSGSEPTDPATLADIETQADALAEQLGRSVLYATWARDKIQSVLNDALDDPAGVTMTDIRQQLGEMVGPQRAFVIARTETANVWNAAARLSIADAGYTKLQRVESSLACDECKDLDGQIYTMEEAEAIGDTIHPNCGGTWVAYGEATGVTDEDGERAAAA